MMKTIRIAVASAICLSTIISCQREEPVIDSTTDLISAKVREVSSVTKSAGFVSEELTQTMVLDGSGLLLQEYVSDNLSQPFPSSIAETKGTVVTRDNIVEEYGEFGMEAFLDNYVEVSAEELSKFGRTLTDTDQYINDGLVSYERSDWVLTDRNGKPYPWLHGMWYSFWSYAPKRHLGTFTYGSVESRGAMSISNYSNPLTSADQKDLLIAYNHRSYNSGDSKTIDIKFRHALADICFDVDAITDFEITKIEIKGAYAKGNCTIDGAYLSDTDVTKAFCWTASTGSKGDFVMTDVDEDNHFFMIPQTLPEGTVICITVEKDGIKTCVEKPMSTKWLAGKYYRYVLKYSDGDISVSVIENFNGTVKSNVSAQNTSTSKAAYLRLAIVANWVNEDGLAVSPVDFTTEGTLVGNFGDNWVKDGGYYYYKYAVRPGHKPSTNLFTSYTPGTAPTSGLSFRMTVMAQGVEFDEDMAFAKSAWGNSVPLVNSIEQ